MSINIIFSLCVVLLVVHVGAYVVRSSLKKNNPVTDENNLFPLELNSDSHAGTSIPLHLKNDQYTGTVYIGGNEEFSFLFDTSYHGLWVSSEKCTSTFCKNHRRYKISKTYVYNGSNIFLQYRGSEMITDQGTDKVKVGELVVNKQLISFLKDDSEPIETDADGVLGLGLQTSCESIYRKNTFFCQLIQGNLIANKVFSMHFISDGDSDGEILFGDWDSSRILDTSLDFIPLSGDKDWTVQISLIKGRNEDWIVSCGLSCEAVIDTSSWSISGPRIEVEKINNYIGADTFGSMATVNCNSVDSLPPITFDFSGLRYTLSGRDYVTEISFNTCVTGFTVGDDFEPWKLGMVFLKKYYTVFNYEKTSIAFANPVK